MEIPGFISLNYPELLLLGLPLIWLYYRQIKWKTPFRTCMLILMILILTRPFFIQNQKGVDYFLMVDRSSSISGQGKAKQAEILEMIRKNLGESDRLSIASFNSSVCIEKKWEEDFRSIYNNPFSPEATDLYGALESLMKLVDPQRHTVLYLLSDGEYTGLDPQRITGILPKNVRIDYRHLGREAFLDLSVQQVYSPQKAYQREKYRITFMVRATADCQGSYRIICDSQPMEQGDSSWIACSFRQGENEISFVDHSEYAGNRHYELEVKMDASDGQEIVTENNRGDAFVRILADQPVLVVNQSGQPDNVSRALSSGGIKIHLVSEGNFHFPLNILQRYQSIILNNVSILQMKYAEIEDLRKYVEEEGGGLLLCGGPQSFAKGGYYKSRLEDLIPVSMEQRKEKKRVSSAFSIVIDRSGSMAMQTPSGHMKITLAAQAAAASMDLLSPFDSLSLIVVDSAAYVIVPQQELNAPDAIRNDILSINSEGGGIFVYQGLMAAGEQVLSADQINKHIILFADAADSEEPGDYVALLSKFRDAGITVSVIGLGSEIDVDAGLLKDIAAKGEGQCYFTEDARQLEQFFSADTMEFSRSTYSEEPAQVQLTPLAGNLTSSMKWAPFSASGYNLLYPKANALIAMQIVEEDLFPTIAFWNRGVGKCVAQAFWTDGNFSQVKSFPIMMLDIIHWLGNSEVEDSFQVYTQRQGNLAHIYLDISDEELKHISQTECEVYSPEGKKMRKTMEWDGRNRLRLTVNLNQRGAWRGNIFLKDRVLRIPVFGLPVSPEFMELSVKPDGKKVMSQLASATGGKEVIQISELFRKNRLMLIQSDWTSLLLMLFLCFLLMDLIEERFGICAFGKTVLLDISNRFRKRSGKPKKDKLQPDRNHNPEFQENMTRGSHPVDTLPPENQTAENPNSDETDPMSQLAKAKKNARKRWNKP